MAAAPAPRGQRAERGDRASAAAAWHGEAARVRLHAAIATPRARRDNARSRAVWPAHAVDGGDGALGGGAARDAAGGGDRRCDSGAATNWPTAAVVDYAILV